MVSFALEGYEIVNSRFYVMVGLTSFLQGRDFLSLQKKLTEERGAPNLFCQTKVEITRPIDFDLYLGRGIFFGGSPNTND